MQRDKSFRSGYIITVGIFFVVSLASLPACRISKPQELPVVETLPAKFEGADSLAATDSAQLVFTQLFNDPFLIALIDSAMKHNTDLQIALQRIISVEARLQSRKAALLPTVSVGVSGGAERYGEYTMNGVGNFDTNLSPNISKDQQIPLSPTTDLFVGVRSDWEIDIWGKLKSLQKAALAEVMATREARQVIITNLVAVLTSKYFQLLSLDAEVKIVNNNIRLQAEALEIVQAQKEGGRATELAVQQFAAQLMNTRAIAFSLFQERMQIQNEISTISGRYPGQLSRDTMMPGLPDDVRMMIGLPASLLANRPDIRQQEWKLKAAKENVNAARKAFLPSLVISPYIGLNAFTPGLLFRQGSGVYGLLGGITAPVFQRKSLKAQYAISNSANQEAVYQYQQTLLDAYGEVVTNMQAVNNHRRYYQLKYQEVTKLKEAVVTARDLYLAGYASYLEIVTAQKNVLEAELELVRKKQEILTAMVNLYRALGGGWQ